MNALPMTIDEDEEHPIAIAEGKRKSHQRECDEMLELRPGNNRTVIDRRQRRKCDKGQRQPGCGKG